MKNILCRNKKKFKNIIFNCHVQNLESKSKQNLASYLQVKKVSNI